MNQCAIGALRTLGVPVKLSVSRKNPAERLYRRLGFTVVGEDELRLRMSSAIEEPRVAAE